MLQTLNTFEIGILDAIAALKCGFLDFLMPIITLLGEDGIFCIALALVLILIPKTRRCGWCVGISLLFGLIVGNLILKPLVARARPYDFNEAFDKAALLLWRPLSDGSFPSGHTMAAFETAGALWLTSKKRVAVPALILAVLVAFSRLYLYAHYPSDVIVGAVLGTLLSVAAVAAVDLAYRLIREKKAAKKNAAE